MGTVTVINTKPYNLQPLPEVGKEYHIFDDGKISYGRHYIAKILKLIPYEDAREITALHKAWEEQVAECYWLYNKTTDYFVMAESDYDKDPLYFVRTKDGGWFSIDYPSCWMGARLDIDGSLYNEMLKWYGDK